MKRTLLMILVGVVIGGLGMSLIPDRALNTTDELVNHASKECQAIDAEKLLELMQGDDVYTLIDVRQSDEHYFGYIPGSVLLPRGSLEFRIENGEFWESEGVYMPLKDEIIVLYCKKGSRGALAAHTLQDLGYKKVYWLEGGWKKWELTYPDYTEKNLEALGGGGHAEDVGGC